MFPVLSPSQIPNKSNHNSKDVQSSEKNTSKGSSEIKESECYLTSVRDLRSSIAGRKHNSACHPFFQHHSIFTWRLVELTEILEGHVFVGIVDLSRCLSLVQHSTNLYLVNHGALAYVPSHACYNHANTDE